MLKFTINNDAILDLYILHGESALDEWLKCLKSEILGLIQELKDSGVYQEYCDKLHRKLLNKAT